MVIIGVLLVYVFVLPAVLNLLVGMPFPLKLVISAGLLTPLGFLMGMPFPTGLSALTQAGPRTVDPPQTLVEWAWAMNASSSVLGSVLAMVIAIQFGLNVTLGCGAAAYALALALSGTLSQRLPSVAAA
jgi:hypothetical protein